ncbi:MAG TPA: GatB/YqeY domain-containing protein [Burkholderiales bacterium]|nr:GatB/YqeY domain-containing protein [Burkholderiales bacterium]
MSLKERIGDDVKAALRAREAARLSALRLLMAAIKQREIDERMALSDDDVLGVIDKMLKQRRESIRQFEAAGRQDLADAEKLEVSVLSAYLPQALTDAEIEEAVAATVAAVGGKSPQDMGRVMAALKPKLAGRADMARVSALVKAKLAG